VLDRIPRFKHAGLPRTQWSREHPQLDHGANPNARDNNDSTPLHLSSYYRDEDYTSHGTVEDTRLLLKYGAVIDCEDNMGRTPLQLALEHDRQDIATCLSENGATR